MTSLSANRVSEMVISAVSACAVITGVAALNTQVRDRIGDILTGDPLTQFSMAAGHAQNFAHFVTVAATTYTNEHTSLVYFGIGGFILVIAMLRT